MLLLVAAGCERRQINPQAGDTGAGVTIGEARAEADADADAKADGSADASADAGEGGACVHMRFVLASIFNHNQYGKKITGTLVVGLEVQAGKGKPERIYLPECNRGDYPSCFNFSGCTGDTELSCTLGKNHVAIALRRDASGAASLVFAPDSDAGPPSQPPVALPDLQRFGCFVQDPTTKGERVIYTDL